MRAVVTYGLDRLPAHEAATHTACAKQIAALAEMPYAGDYCSGDGGQDSLYFVPSRTLVRSEAQRLRIHGEDDLFGGAVAAEFVATKAISHPLVASEAVAPAEWSHEFEHAVREVVLKGCTIFSMRDAQRVGEKLVDLGPLRVKPTGAAGAQGQALATNKTELTSALVDIDEREISRCGLVFEENLTRCETLSVGYSHIAGLKIAYTGAQRLTRNNSGKSVYGGSDLFLVKGGLQDLRKHTFPQNVCLAIDQAQLFDAAVGEFYPAMFASRRNYDVAQGLDWQGNWRSGVLEQSWRIGGATPAELAALEAFKFDPRLQSVRTSSVELYGSDRSSIPVEATIYFEGVDDRVGPMIKYAMRHAES
jgi:hypothetical protein